MLSQGWELGHSISLFEVGWWLLLTIAAQALQRGLNVFDLHSLGLSSDFRLYKGKFGLIFFYMCQDPVCSSLDQVCSHKELLSSRCLLLFPSTFDQLALHSGGANHCSSSCLLFLPASRAGGAAAAQG